ncbi:putative recombination initiation defects 3 [Arachis duranensis]|uniref:Recombination initiation defects 3 n=1 Tax=Arachis duranensis TaxID=130453 RepID=A0A9C6WPA2_ARADU|nr:putative recombination initiation defects 3 [Arachis duranensis]
MPDTRVGSQEQENSLRNISSFPHLTYSREESQTLNSKSSSNLKIKQNPPEQRSQLNDGLEHRIGMMETSLRRFAMILDSVQCDVMQINKETKEVTLEMGCIKQKLIAQDNSLQLITNGQEETKARIEESLKSLLERMSKGTTDQEKLQEVYSVVSTLPQLIEASLRSLQIDLHNSTTEMQEISRTIRNLNDKDLIQSNQSSKNICSQFTRPEMHQPPANKGIMSLEDTVAPGVEMGGLKTVKQVKVTFSDRMSKNYKQKEPSINECVRGGRDKTIVIESDEEFEEGFSCLAEEKEANALSKKNVLADINTEGTKGEVTNRKLVTSEGQAAVSQENEGVRRSTRVRKPNTKLEEYVLGPRPRPIDLFANLTKEEEEETQRILQKARRRKRRSLNAVIIN